jgi:hypothetical protein
LNFEAFTSGRESLYPDKDKAKPGNFQTLETKGENMPVRTEKQMNRRNVKRIILKLTKTEKSLSKLTKNKTKMDSWADSWADNLTVIIAPKTGR